VVVIGLTVDENIEIWKTEPNSLVKAGHHHMPPGTHFQSLFIKFYIQSFNSSPITLDAILILLRKAFTILSSTVSLHIISI